MSSGSHPAQPIRVAIAAVAACTLLAAVLRSYGLAHQVVIDDEWHAILKLMGATYGEIARAKGFAHVASGPLVRSSYHAADFHPVVR